MHVKTLAFKVVKYLIDGIIDGEIKEDDLNRFKESMTKPDEDELNMYCDKCRKNFKTKSGMRIHLENIHGIQQEACCESCGRVFKTKRGMIKHIEKTHGMQTQLPGVCCKFLRMKTK